MFKELDLYPLAYLTAKSNGFDTSEILEAAGFTEDQISMPELGEPLSTPRAVVDTHKANWPVKATSSSAFEKALLGEAGAEDELPPATNGYGDEDILGDEAVAEKNGVIGEGEEEVDAEGWDMGEDVEVEPDSDFVNVEAVDAGAGSSEADLWTRNSPIAADHAAAGSFDSAMQLLNRQVGAVNFKPLQWRFEEIYQASRTFLPANADLAPLVNYMRRTTNETDMRRVLPLIPRDLESVTTTEFQAGKTAMQKNKLEDGVQSFRKVLHLLILNAVSTQKEVSEAKALIHTAAQYVLGMTVELERRKLINNQADISTFPEEIRKRALELSAYFTIPEMEPPHVTLALFTAMNFAHKNKQFSSALTFANNLIEKGTNTKFKESVRP